MATSNIEYLEDLFNQRRYAEVMQRIAAAETDPELGALRADAQDYFKAGMNRISEIYRDICGTTPPTVQQEEMLRMRYDQDVGAIFEPLEAETYACALLRDAVTLENQRAEHTDILVRVYAAGTLPINAPDLEHQIAQERTRLEGSPGNAHIPGNGQPGTAQTTTVLLPETARDRARAQASDGVAPLQKELEALLDRPPRDWLCNEAGYEQQFQHLRTRLQAMPGDHAAMLQRIDNRYNQQKNNLKPLKDKLDQLAGAADKDLYLLLLGLEEQLGSDYPDLAPYQERRDVYLERFQQTLNGFAAELRQPQADLEALQQRLNIHHQPAEKSPFKGLFDKLQQQLAARQNQVTSFNTLLQKSIRDWLKPSSKLHDQANKLLTAIATDLDADSALVKDLRSRFNQRVAEYRDVHARLQGLDNLEGPALIKELAGLEELLGAKYSALRNHQQRRTQYEAEQQRRQEAAQREARWMEIRHLRTEFDTALKSYRSTAETFNTLREKARTASQDISMDLEEHPFNPEIFAYYDLLCADYLSNLENEATVAARTAANMGDLISAVRILENNLVEAQKSDNDRDKGLAQHALDKTIKELIEQTEQEIGKALVEARALLADYNYAAALNNLNIQQTNLERARQTLNVPITIDETLLRELDTEIANAKALEQLGQEADELEQQARETAPEAGETPDYPRAITLLQQAGSKAIWRKAALDEVIGTFRRRQDKFVVQCIARADTETRMENYPAAAEWLQRADKNAVTEEQRRQINEQHTTIHAQQKNVERHDQIRIALQTIIDEGRKGENIEQLRPRIAKYRTEIGTRDQPKFDDTRWAELDDYLRQAEGQIKAWQEYMTLRSQAEAAAISGDTKQVDKTIRQMSAMSAYTFLPIQHDTALIRSMAGIGERAERVRALLREVRDKFQQDEHTITVEDIDRAVRNSSDFTEDTYTDIIRDRHFLIEKRPLYAARAALKGYIEDGLFDQVEPTIIALSQDLQDDATIRTYKREAARQIAEREFQTALGKHLNDLKGIFEYALSDPQRFQEKIHNLTRFADEAAPDLRKTEPKLDTRAIAQLNDLAERLLANQRQREQKDFDHALTSLDAILAMLPDSDADTNKELACYSHEIGGLRTNIEKAKEKIEEYDKAHRTIVSEVDSLIKDYRAAISGPSQCFNADALNGIIIRMGQLQDTTTQDPRIDTALVRLREIIRLLEEVDSTFSMVLSGKDHQDDDPDHSIPSPNDSPRVTRITQRLAEARRQSDAIKQPGGGAEDWPGIRKYPPYQILNNLQDVAATLDAADRWLQQTDSLPPETSKLKKLRVTGKDLVDRLDKATQTVQNEIEQHRQVAPNILAQLALILASCEEKRLKIHKWVVDQIDPGLKQQQQQHKLTRTLVLVTLALAAIFGAIWYVPTLEPMKNNAIALVMGTPTPTPIFTATPTLVPGATAVPPTWTPVVVTATPVPPPTPVAPQAGVIIFPGRAWTYSQPALGAERRAYIEGGLSIDITGFTDDSEGSRWYRINAAAAGLNNVWVLQQIVYEQDRQPRETVRLLDNNGLNEALFIPFDQAMQ